MDEGKQEIINRFNNNVRGRKPDTSNSNQDHDGKSGHWLERQMGIEINNRTEADLFGYEMKNQTTSGKTTFGIGQQITIFLKIKILNISPLKILE